MQNEDNDNTIFNQLLKLQCILRKESSVKELCKKKNIINWLIYVINSIYSF